MNVDYIIVGCGLAAIGFCEELKNHGKSFVVYDDNSQRSSTVAGGLYNPVILKRFTPVWKSEEQLDIALPMYAKLEKDLKLKLDYKVPVRRRLLSVEEQNNWFAATDQPRLHKYMSVPLVKTKNEAITANFDLGEVLQTGRIDTKALILAYRNLLKKNNQFYEQRFDYNAIIFNTDSVSYDIFKTRHIIFAEGFGMKQNPYFKNLPLQGTKGELITIHAPALQLNYVLKSSVFIIPLGDDLYRVGSTYEWKDKTNTPTEEAKDTLIKKLESFINCDYEVVDHVAGIRPTVSGRRPLVGRHKTFSNLYVLNGLGTRGVMIGPYVAKQLFNFIENNEVLDEEIDITRFN